MRCIGLVALGVVNLVLFNGVVAKGIYKTSRQKRQIGDDPSASVSTNNGDGGESAPPGKQNTEGQEDPAVAAGRGKGSSGDGSGLQQDPSEPVALSDNGAVEYPPPQDESLDVNTTKEGEVQERELEKLINGFVLTGSDDEDDDDDDASEVQAEARAAMGYLSRHTCMEFVPYKGPATNEELQLGHPGHIIFDYTGGNCWSYIGVVRKPSGQVVSCKRRDVFIHELGHAAFLLHEQNGDHRKGLIRINYENIDAGYLSQYMQIRDKQVLHTGYDISSMAHYGLYMGSKNRKPAMSVLYSAPEFHVGGHMYYMAAEINSGYKCREKDCPDFNIECVKDSYAVKRNGKCQCECTRGIDPATGCSDPKKEAMFVDTWGPGSLAFFKPVDGCPSGSSELTIEQEGDASGKGSSVYHLASAIATKNSIPLCQIDAGTGEWPDGQYCFFVVQDTCPEGMVYGQYTMTNADGTTTILKFCCKNTGFTYEEIQIKNKEPFTMVALLEKCQDIQDMYVYKEFVILDSAAEITEEGTVPGIEIAKDNALKLNFCYYVPQNYGCGRAIDLTPDNPSATFNTVNYPSNYTKSTECTWIVTASEKDSIIVLDFDDKTFCLEAGDHVDIHNNRIGQPSIRSTGRGYRPSVMTLYNMLKVQFRSDLETECTGFTATVRMVRKEDQSYSLDDEGASYRGSTNFTHNKIPCKPWTAMTHCPHHTFAPGDEADGLDRNYCRNPGDGFAPWCYYEEDNCQRNYCDVSKNARPADNYPDCDKILEAIPDFCEDENKAVAGCFKTCSEHIHYNAESVKASEVTCKKPGAIEDAEIVDAKDSYTLGEKVVYKCTSGAGELERLCTTTGDWTPGGYVCGECPRGWLYYSDSCYLYFDPLKMYEEARDHCKSLEANLMSIKSQGESDFLEAISRPTTGQWLGMLKDTVDLTKFIWDDDGTVVGANGYLNWREGAPKPRAARKNGIMLGKINKMQWRSLKNRSTFKMSYTCKKAASGTRPCIDRHPNCQQIVSEFPMACQKYSNGWGDQQCRKTCGLCGETKACEVPAPAANVQLVSGKSNLEAGHVVEYKCEEGFTLVSGQLTRTCLGTGSLTGSDAVCVDTNSVVRPSNNMLLIPRTKALSSYRTHSGTTATFNIDGPGKVIAWEFYLQFKGTTVFQIWRPYPPKPLMMTLIGQNVVEVSAVRPHTVPVPTEEQILVEAGDRIGIWNPFKRAGIGFASDPENTEGGLLMTDPVYYVKQLKLNAVYQFKATTPLIVSARAVIAPR